MNTQMQLTPQSTNQLFLFEEQKIKSIKNLRKLISLVNQCQGNKQGLLIHIPEEKINELVWEYKEVTLLELDDDIYEESPGTTINKKPEASLGSFIRGNLDRTEYFSISDMVKGDLIYQLKEINQLIIPLDKIANIGICIDRCWEGDKSFTAYIKMQEGYEISVNSFDMSEETSDKVTGIHSC